jgi:hypothetical protein
MSNIILTGIPRSGTTLAAAILDNTSNCFCLSEPDSHRELMDSSSSKDDFVNSLELEFLSIRSKLLAGIEVPDKRMADGSAVTNYFSAPSITNHRSAAYTLKKVGRNNLTEDFALGIKHNALYAAVLPEILSSNKFKVVILVRNPMDVVASWRSLDLPVSQGFLPAADRYWPEMRELTHSAMPLLDKQLFIYELMCSRFLSFTDQACVVRYENMVERPEILLHAAGISGKVIATKNLIQSTPKLPQGNEIEIRIDFLKRAGQRIGNPTAWARL